jgi:hypothetical protein
MFWHLPGTPFPKIWQSIGSDWFLIRIYENPPKRKTKQKENNG